jgi:ankyrin repeat protein
VYYGEQAIPIEELVRSHGAYTQPYHMNARQMKQAIRAGHEVTRHPEFLGNLMGQGNAKLLDLYLDSDPTGLDRLADELAIPWSAVQARKLLARGLDPNRTDWLGKTFLHACAARGDRSTAAVFLDAGADINARSIEFDETPLATAIRSGFASQEPEVAERRRQMVEFLLKRGARANLPDDEPWATPLAWARKLGLADIEEILLKHGATG